MNDAHVLSHPAFDRAPVPNAKRRGPTPRDVPLLSRERRRREAKAREETRSLTPDERLAEYDMAIREIAHGLLMAVQSVRMLQEKLQDETYRG